jgi:hypothetical protein
MEKSLTIRNSTAEFLIFQLENREDGVQLLYSDETQTKRKVNACPGLTPRASMKEC